MTGLIWVIQCIQYPLFTKVSSSDFPAFHADYVKRIGRIVFLVMPVELGLAIYLFFTEIRPQLQPWTAAGLAVLILIWLSTAFVQAMQHQKLRERYSAEMVLRLVAGNWIRTVLWTVRAGIAALLLSFDCI